MSFHTWFKSWILAFTKLFTVNGRRRQSKAQREKARLRRIKGRFSGENLYRRKKKRKSRRSSHDVQMERMLGALGHFMAVSLGILLLPFGLLDWGRKAVRAGRKARKASKGSKSRKNSSRETSRAHTPKQESTPVHAGTTSKPAAGTAKARTVPVPHTPTGSTANPQGKGSATSVPIQVTLSENEKITRTVVAEVPPAPPSEDVPKSTPRSERDQYIRKRMIIVGSYYCDARVLRELKIGTYFDLEAEPENPYDRNAVKLVYNGEKIGYVAKQDQRAFVTCLRLRRRIYGVITDVIVESGRTKYEFETWFA